GIGPIIVKGIGQGFTDEAVLKDGTAGIIDKRLHAHRQLVGDLFLLDLAFVNGFTGIQGGPVLGGVLLAQVVMPGLEGFQGNRVVLVVVVNEGVEVIHAFVDRQILAPIVVDPLPGYGAASVETLDAVRATAQGGLQVGGAKIPLLPPMFGQDGHLAENQGQFLILVSLKDTGDLVVIDDFDFAHVAPVGP